MVGEAGVIGLVTGTLFLGSIFWACARPALRNRDNVVVATMWIVPFAFSGRLRPPPTSLDNGTISSWSAVAVALAGAQIGSQVRSDTKT